MAVKLAFELAVVTSLFLLGLAWLISRIKQRGK